MPGQGSQVAVTVKSELLRVVEDLRRIAEEQQKLSEGLKETTEGVGKVTDEQTRQVRTSFGKMKDYGRSVAKTLKDDFRALFALNAVGGALKLSEQFRGSIRETVALSDTVRRLGSTFGIAESRFSSFQAKLTKGLGTIGLSSEVATRSLEGLAETPVRGEENLVAYSRLAGQLASISGSQGQEGNIARGISDVLVARGQNPNDVKAAASVAEDLRRVQNATGKKPTDTLNSMTQLFSGMDKAMRQKISTRGLANLAAISTTAGPNSTKFLEEFMQAGSIGRMRFEAQGFKDVFNDQGLDVEKFRKSGAGIMGRIGQDPRMAAQTLGISEQAAEGFVRLYESLDRVKAAQEAVRTSTGNLERQYLESRSLGDSFRASINRVKSVLAEPLATVTQGATKMLSKASETDIGSAAVVGGGAIAAAVLAGGGLRGIGKSLLGGAAKSAAVEAVTGEKVQKVEVINWPLGGLGVGAAGVGAGGAALTGAAATAGAAAVAVGGGLAAGSLVEYIGGGGLENDLRNLFSKIASDNNAVQRNPNKIPVPYGTTTKVEVELRSKELKEVKRPGRGG